MNGAPFSAGGNTAAYDAGMAGVGMGMGNMPPMAARAVSPDPQAAALAEAEEAARLREQSKQMDLMALFAEVGLDPHRQ